MASSTGSLYKFLGTFVPAQGGGRLHPTPCRCGHGVHTTHVVEPMCTCSSHIVCLRHSQGHAMVPPWCGQGFFWWLPSLSRLPPLKEQYKPFSLFLKETSICLRKHNGNNNFNYKLKFQVPQPSSAPPKSGALAMPIWYAHGACLARPQCASGPLTVRILLARGARAVCVWLACGARPTRSRCASCSPVVRVRPARDLLTWLLEFEPPNLQDFPAFILGFHGCKAYPWGLFLHG